MKLTIASITLCSALAIGSAAFASERHEADKAIETTLRATLNARHVHVHVHEGVVTLEGHVRSEQDRQSIESMVRNTSGVAAVKDELKVALPSPGETLPSPGATVVAPTYRTAVSVIPVYTTPPPEVIRPAPVVTMPTPVVVPEYPRLKVQAYTSDDVPVANLIARQMAIDAVPTAGLEDVTITIRGSIVSLRGTVESHEDRDALIEAIQHAGGMKAIYDQLQVQ